MPASNPATASAASADENRFASLTPACLSKGEKASLMELALDVLSRRFRPGRSFTAPEDIRGLLRLKLSR